MPVLAVLYYLTTKERWLRETQLAEVCRHTTMVSGRRLRRGLSELRAISRSLAPATSRHFETAPWSWPPIVASITLVRLCTKSLRKKLALMIDYIFIFSGKNNLRRTVRRISGERFQLGRTSRNKFPRSQEKVASSQNTGQARGVSGVRRIATVQYRAGVIPRVIPRPWLVAESAVHHESSIRPVDRAGWPTYPRSTRNRQLFLVVEGFAAPEVIYSSTRGTVASLLSRGPPSKSL